MPHRVPDVLAAVDLGSNSFHMIVARYNHGQLIVLDRLSRRDEERALALAGELVATREERAFYSAAFDRMARRSLATAVLDRGDLRAQVVP